MNNCTDKACLVSTDRYMRVEVISKTPRPNLISYAAMHQDYSEGAVYDEWEKLAAISEEELGERLVKHCIKQSHWGVIEHPCIIFNCIGFPHAVMVQARTHRVGISFDVQSQRYTGKRILNLANYLISSGLSPLRGDCEGAGLEPSVEKLLASGFERIEKVFYFRPLGTYTDREGNKYQYTDRLRRRDLLKTWQNILDFSDRIEKHGMAPEHARDMLFQNIRQNFVVSFNARSLLHFCDLRVPQDAQLEIRIMSEKIFAHFKSWMPQVAEHYEKTRLGKNKLAP